VTGHYKIIDTGKGLPAHGPSAINRSGGCQRTVRVRSVRSEPAIRDSDLDADSRVGDSITSLKTRDLSITHWLIIARLIIGSEQEVDGHFFLLQQLLVSICEFDGIVSHCRLTISFKFYWI
jgi:hypothetical protein